MKFPWAYPKTRILFVCLANVCRSPLAENLLENALKKHHLKHQVAVDSAAIEDWSTGRPLHKELQRYLSEDNIPVKRHRCRVLTEKDGERFDYIITFDDLTFNASKMRVGASNASKVSLFPSIQEDGTHYGIIDPMETYNFEACYQEIKRGIPTIIDDIQDILNN